MKIFDISKFMLNFNCVSGIRTPLKCPDCPMQFCTVRSLLWHFGNHEGRSDRDIKPPVLLEDLLVPWNNIVNQETLIPSSQYPSSSASFPFLMTNTVTNSNPSLLSNCNNETCSTTNSYSTAGRGPVNLNFLNEDNTEDNLQQSPGKNLTINNQSSMQLLNEYSNKLLSSNSRIGSDDASQSDSKFCSDSSNLPVNKPSKTSNKDIILKVPIPRLKNKNDLLLYYKKRPLKKLQNKTKLVSILPKVPQSIENLKESNNELSVNQATTSPAHQPYKMNVPARLNSRANSVQIQPIWSNTNSKHSSISLTSQEYDMNVSSLTAERSNASSSSDNIADIDNSLSMSDKPINLSSNSASKFSSPDLLSQNHPYIESGKTSNSTSIGEKDGLVMINPSLGLRIVSSSSSSISYTETNSLTSTTNMTSIRPIMSQMTVSSNGLTIMPQLGGVEAGSTKSMLDTKAKSPDILTIIPQVDIGKYGKRPVSKDQASKASSSCEPQIMTAAGKVNACSSQIVKLILLPNKSGADNESKNSKSDFSSESNSSSNGNLNKLKKISSFEEGEKVDTEEDSMDPLSMCAVTMEDDNTESPSSSPLSHNNNTKILHANNSAEESTESHEHRRMLEDCEGDEFYDNKVGEHSVSVIPLAKQQNNVTPKDCFSYSSSFPSPSIETSQGHVSSPLDCSPNSKVAFKVRGKTHEVDVDKYEQRKYVCNYCQRRFGWSTDLKRHIILHTGERPFQCKFCPVAFTRKFLLQNHMKKLHPDKCRMGDLWPHHIYN